jgi:hypothetical protein
MRFSQREMLCLSCRLSECHKGHHLCEINKAERQTRQYWIDRYHKSGRKYLQIKQIAEKRK